MRRFLLNSTTVFSILLFVCVIVLWVDSHFNFALVVYEGSTRAYGVGSDQGDIFFIHATGQLRGIGWTGSHDKDGKDNAQGIFRSEISNIDHNWWLVGFSVNRKPSGNNLLVVFPHWFAALLTTFLPILWFTRYRWRHKPGYCRKCRYDLRGADHKRCPECGSTVPKNPPPS